MRQPFLSQITLVFLLGVSAARAARNHQTVPGSEVTQAPVPKRQVQVPISIPSVIPTAVDTRYYTVSDAMTSFIGPDPAYLTVSEVTGTVDGQTTTATETLSMALHTATPSGSSEIEYSLVVSPELSNEISQVFISTSTESELAERDLITAAADALVELLGPKIATSILELVNLGASVGGAEAALGLLAGGAIALGEFIVPAVVFTQAIVGQIGLIGELLKSGDARLSAVRVPMDKMRNSKTCSGTATACSSCNGIGLVCTSGPDTGCACEEDEKCPEGEDTPFCDQDDCKGILGTCSTTKCPCRTALDVDSQPVFTGDASWYGIQQQWLQNVIVELGVRDHPSAAPTCGSSGLTGIAATPDLPLNQMISSSSHATYIEILTKLQNTLCSKKCEVPEGIDSPYAVKVTEVMGACEIAVGLTAVGASMEVFAYHGSMLQEVHWQDCWDSFSNITDKCMKFENRDASGDPQVIGLVEGPDSNERFHTGFRPLNSDQAMHEPISPAQVLKPWCGDSVPDCGTCSGSNSHCTSGQFNGCFCNQPVVNSPPQDPYPLCTAQGVDVGSLNCIVDCCGGGVPCRGWCNDNCGGSTC